MLDFKLIFFMPLLLLVQAEPDSGRRVPVRGPIVSRDSYPGHPESHTPAAASNRRPYAPSSPRPSISPSQKPIYDDDRLYDYSCERTSGYEAMTNKCNYYIECKNNIAYQYKCPKGLHFDSDIQYPRFPCNYPSQVTCRRKAIEGRPIEVDVEPSYSRNRLHDYNCNRYDQYEAVPNRCDYFVECYNNKAYEYVCPNGQYFDDSIKYPNFPCNYKSQVTCPSRERPKPREPAPAINRTPKEPKLKKNKLYDYSCKRNNAYEGVPDNCNNFIECSNNNAYEVTCPDGLAYDASIRYPHYPCNYDSQVICERELKKARSKPSKPVVERNPIEPKVDKVRLYDHRCKRNNDYEAVINKCNNYIECSNNNAYEVVCPHGLAFDATVRYPNFPCNYDSQTVCEKESIRAASSVKPKTALKERPHKQPASAFDRVRLNDYDCKRRNGYEEVLHKCYQYIECSENIAYKYTCPEGLFYDSKIVYPNYPCNYDSLVICKRPVIIEPTERPSTPRPTRRPSTPVPSNKIRLHDYDCKRRNGYEMIPNKCSLYVECTDDIAYEVKCPSGLYFDASARYPSLPCSHSSKNCHGFNDPGKETGSASCSKRNMYAEVNGQCDVYTECRDYHAVEMQCPDGLHYNPDTMWPNYPCDYPSNVDCTGRGAAQQAVPTADCEHQYGFFPSPLAQPNDCGHYRQCVGGKAFEMYCPKGLAFNFEINVCDWPSDVNTCNGDAYINYNCPSASFTKGVPVTTNHEYEGDCYAFYACLNGQARILTCDAGMAFNPASARCEDNSIVQCTQERGQ